MIRNEIGIGISFDGGFSNHIFRRNISQNLYDKLVKAIKYIIQQGYRDYLLVSTVINSEHLTELPEFLSVYKHLGLSQFQLIQDSDKALSISEKKVLRQKLREYKVKHPEMSIYICPENAFNCDTCIPSTLLVYPNGDIWDMCTLTTSSLLRREKITQKESMVTFLGTLDSITELEIDIEKKRKIIRPNVFCPTLSHDWHGVLDEFVNVPDKH